VVDVSRVETFPFFAPLPAALKAGLAEGFDELAVPAGGRVMNQGDFAYELLRSSREERALSRTARWSQRSARVSSAAKSDCC
jgi:hypothetical protein